MQHDSGYYHFAYDSILYDLHFPGRYWPQMPQIWRAYIQSGDLRRRAFYGA